MLPERALGGAPRRQSMPGCGARCNCFHRQAGVADHPSTRSERAQFAECLILGIETSCDETAAAVVTRDAEGRGRILSSVVRTQWEQHRPYGGVVPEIAARAHVECLNEIIAAAMAQAGIGFGDLSAVAATGERGGRLARQIGG